MLIMIYLGFAEQSFEMGRKIVDYNNMLNREIGSFRGTILGMFRPINYTRYLGITRDIQSCIGTIESQINTLPTPSSEQEKCFSNLLLCHVKAIRQYSDFLVEQAEFLYKRSRSLKGNETSWKIWKDLIKNKQPIIQECHNSGTELTLYYHKMSKLRQ